MTLNVKFKITIAVTIITGLNVFQTKASQICPTNWRVFEGKCYKIYSRNRDAEDKSFEDASRYCRAMGSRLASIKNQHEQDFITSYLGEPSEMSKVWIGLKKIPTFQAPPDRFLWEDGTDLDSTSFRNFAPGEPNGGSYENCVHLQVSEVVAGKWNDHNCEGRRGFICEKGSSGLQDKWTYGYDPRCPNGFQHYRDTCYRLFSETWDWESAERKCQSDFDGHLISIHDLYDEAFLALLVGNLTDEIWIGFSDRNKKMEGLFSWSDGSPVYHLNWDNNQPNETEPNNRCVARQSKRDWTVTDCSKKLKFVCSKRLVKPDTEIILGDCPINWINVGNNFCYYIQTEVKVSWEESGHLCSNMGSNVALASFRKAHDLKLLRPYLAKYVDDRFSIGIKAISPPDFSFVGESVEASYLPWEEGEPNNINRERCVSLSPRDMRYFNHDCDSELFYICQANKSISKRLPSEYSRHVLPHKDIKDERGSYAVVVVVVGVICVSLVLLGGAFWFHRRRITYEKPKTGIVKFKNEVDD